jgi:LysM repeat protein
MTNTTPRSGTPIRVCPTCGTRIAETAVKCAVCGTLLGRGGAKPYRAPSGISGTSATVNLPVGAVIAGPVISLLIGALAVVFLVRAGYLSSAKTAISVSVASPSITLTLLPSDTQEPTNTPSPLPPNRDTVKEGDNCYSILSRNNIRADDQNKYLNLITTESGKPVDCSNLQPGEVILIPQYTPTMPPPATATMNALNQTEEACTFDSYTVVEGDSISGISIMYNVPVEAIKRWNKQYGFENDVVFPGMVLRIPLCERNPTQGPSPTPTTPPPYPAPNLLTPPDGTVFGAAEEDIALQWATVYQLKENELFRVTIKDISMGAGTETVLYTNENRKIVPKELRPTDGSVHVFQWSVSVVRQTGSTEGGKTVYVSAGAESERRVFAWGGVPPVMPTPTP